MSQHAVFCLSSLSLCFCVFLNFRVAIPQSAPGTMGDVSLSTWRARIGCFNVKKCKVKLKKCCQIPLLELIIKILILTIGFFRSILDFVTNAPFAIFLLSFLNTVKILRILYSANSKFLAPSLVFGGCHSSWYYVEMQRPTQEITK